MNLLAKRIPTLIGLLFIGAAIFGYFYFFQGKKASVAEDIVPQRVKITNIADNKFSVSWTTKTPTPGQIEYGVVGDKLTTKVNDDRDANGKLAFTTHHITLSSLQPNTQYGFRILSGDPVTRFDNNGSPYTATTGAVIGATPPSVNFYGDVVQGSKQPAGGAIVYMTLPSGATSSTLTGERGNYTFTLSTMRSTDLTSYVKYDPSATIANLIIDNGVEQTVSNVSLANSAPVPTITMGQSTDFLNSAITPDVAAIEQPTSSAQPTTQEEVPITPSIFNVEPLAGAEINVVSTESVVLLNPKDEGETITALRPEFRGTGPAKTTLSIALTGQKAISDTVEIGTDKTWSWSPVVDLKTGKQKITISYVTASGTTQKIERNFTISTSTTGLDPAFVSSPSASVAKVSPTPKPTSTPRANMPATDSGVPVTGVIENTLLTAGLGIVIMIVGAALLAL